MTYSKLFDIPTNVTVLKSQPLFSKRVARARRQPRNLRKHQVKLGQIVYYHGRGIVPMRVLGIDDCALWATGARTVTGTTTNRHGYNIYYDLQPLTTRYGEWRAKKFIRIRKTKPDWMQHNNHLWDNGWIGHAVDMDQFALTYAEAKWERMKWR